MKKSELVERMAQRFPHLTLNDHRIVVAHLLEGMTDALKSGRRVEVRGFGSFSVHFRPAKQGRNPRSGDLVEIAAKHMPHFKQGKVLLESVQSETLPD